MTKQKKVSIKLLGDPGSSFYNFGTSDKPIWKKGGDEVEVEQDLARRLVLWKQAVYLNGDAVAEALTQATGANGGMEFDQTPSAGEQK